MVLAERRNSQLGRHAGFLEPRIRGHEADFVDADALGTGEGGLQLESQFRGLRFARGKGAHKAPKLFFGHGRKELDAREPRGGEQLRKLFFSGRPFQRYPVQ
jgi:hypothetical protein